ncbi:hypothetical protein BIV60_26455 [Bacillus sp. MUM 116]|uniref:hypothetical protein n=1 Tax=Bacillus sp. MUM 116 TaxID=1678002 RepID=UPI0008F5E532|nr:hypothetical protein [Bacillus sp. MUM 116]OIK08410.1 hypothetical protein BIV60_26455 [Bacillus sp. MUM 116]
MDITYSGSLKNSKSKKNSIKLNFSILFVIFLFIVNETTRSVLGEKVGLINIPFLLIGISFISFAFRNGRIRPAIFLIVTLFSAIDLIVSLFLQKSGHYYVITISNLLTPLFLLSVIINKEQALKTLRCFVKYFNVYIIIVLFFGIIDYFTNSSIQLFLARTVYKGQHFAEILLSEKRLGIYRFYFISGHPLQNSKYFLIFFIVNSIYARYDKYLLNKYLISIITIIGLILSGSKTALVIGATLVIFFNSLKKYKWVYISITVCFLIVFFNTPLFQNNLGMRFQQGIKSGDLTSGRNDVIKMILTTNEEKPQLFYGGGAGYSREVVSRLNTYSGSFEYPIIMFSYDYGVFGMVLIYFCILIYPLYVFVKRKQWYLFFSFLLLTLYINTNNGIAQYEMDSMSQLCFIILILVNLGKEPLGNNLTLNRI